MNKLIRPGQIMFGIGIISLGVLQFFAKDFIVGRPPAASWATHIPGKLAWAYLSGSLFIIAGIGVIFNFKAKFCAITMGLLILIFSFFLRHLYELSDWVNAYKSLALSGGAFIVAASFTSSIKQESSVPDFFTDYSLMFMGCLFLSLFLVSAGLAHFKFDDFVISLVPSYMKALYFWTYFAAICLLLGGIGLLSKKTRKWAALLSGIMILLWFFMVHIPRAIGTPDAATPHYGEWMGVFESFAFSGISFVLAAKSSSHVSRKKEQVGTTVTVPVAVSKNDLV